MPRLLKDEPQDEKKTTCGECYSKVAYFPSEVQKAIKDDYGGGSDWTYWIVCPRCKKNISVFHPFRT